MCILRGWLQQWVILVETLVLGRSFLPHVLDGGRCISLVSTPETSWRSCKETFYPRRTLACLNSWGRNSCRGQIRQMIKNSRLLWQMSSFENSHIFCCFETPERLHVSKGCFSGHLTEFTQWNVLVGKEPFRWPPSPPSAWRWGNRGSNVPRTRGQSREQGRALQSDFLGFSTSWAAQRGLEPLLQSSCEGGTS